MRKSMKVGGGGRFAALKAKLAARGDVSNPGAVAAAIGRKKYGKAKFQKMAAHGKNRVHHSYVQMPDNSYGHRFNGHPQ
jgi:hypothetical protein